MTITINLIDESCDETINNDGKPVINFHEVWRMRDTNSGLVNINQARLNFQSNAGIQPGYVYSNFPYAYCKTVTPRKGKAKPPNQYWEVAVDYTTDCPLIDDPDPSHRRWVRSSSISSQQRYIFRDKNNQLIVDAAGSPFDGGIPVDVELTTLTWKHNTDWSVYDLGTQGKLSGCINSDTWAGCSPFTLKLAYTYEEQWEGKYHFASETFAITYDPLGWKPKPANAGLFYLKSGVRTRIKDAAGKDAQEPEPLTTAGAVVPVGSRPGSCTFITVDYYPTLAFDSLGLPLT